MATILPSSGYEFLLADDSGNGVLLNTDATPSAPFVDIENVAGLDSPDFRETFRDHEGTDGGFLDAEFEKGRDITLTGTVYGPQALLEAYLDTLKKNYAPRLSSLGLLRFYFYTPGVGLRYLLVKPRGIRYDWSQGRRTGQVPVQIRMFAEDPRIYSYPSNQVVSTLTIYQTNGFGFNLGFSFGFGGMGTTDGFTAYNSGNRTSPLKVTIMGPCDVPRVLNDTVAGIVQVEKQLLAQDLMVIDLGNHTIFYNGVNVRGLASLDKWFGVEQGNNALRFQTGDNYSGSVQNPALNSNYNIETGLSPWVINGAPSIVTWSDDYALFGSHSIKATGDGATLNFGPMSEFVAVTTGSTYTASGWTYLPETWIMNCAINWYDSGQVFLSTSFGVTQQVLAKQWTRTSVVATAPASAAFARIRPSRTANNGIPPAGFVSYTDMATLTLGSNPPSFAQFEWASAWR